MTKRWVHSTEVGGAEAARTARKPHLRGGSRGAAPPPFQALREPRQAGSPWHSLLFCSGDGRDGANAGQGPAAKCCPGPGSPCWGLLQGGPAVPAGTRAAAGSAWERPRTGPWGSLAPPQEAGWVPLPTAWRSWADPLSLTAPHPRQEEEGHLCWSRLWSRSARHGGRGNGLNPHFVPAHTKPLYGSRSS